MAHTPFITGTAIPGFNDFGQEYCVDTYTATLTINTDTGLTVPGYGSMGNFTAPSKNKFMAVIRVTDGASVWFAVNATAAVPAGASFAASTSELIIGGPDPFGKVVKTGDILHFFSAAANISVSVALYPLQNF